MGAQVLKRLRSNVNDRSDSRHRNAVDSLSIEPGIRMLFTLLLERIDRWLRNTHRTRCDEYLAASKDIAELERRMKECDG